MSKPLVFGLTGEMLSGKSMAAKFLVDHFAVKELRMSAVLNNILDVLDLPHSRENQQNLARMLREQFGEQILAYTTAEQAEHSKEKERAFLIDGIRKIKELEELRKRCKLVLIYIKAPIELRYARMKERNEKVGEHLKSFEEFKVDHKAESEIDIPKLEQFADYVLENIDNGENIKAQLTKIITATI